MYIFVFQIDAAGCYICKKPDELHALLQNSRELIQEFLKIASEQHK